MGKDKTHFGGSLSQVHGKQQKAKQKVKHVHNGQNPLLQIDF